jgi:excisionase family DNA binding protein
MNENVEIQRLTKAIANLANILVKTTTAKVREQMPAATVPKTQYIQRPIDNLMTKKDVAAYLKLSLRTVSTLMNNGDLPYIRLNGRSVRFMLETVQNAMARRSTVGR